MNCTNFENVGNWIMKLQEKGIEIRRYRSLDVSKLPPIDGEAILKENLHEWLSGKDHVTFWHLKQLMLNLQNTETMIPVVGTMGTNIKSLFIDPGGSRLTAMQYLGKTKVDLDVILPVNRSQSLGGNTLIDNPVDLLAPYETIGINYSVEMCEQDPCAVCESNNVVHNGDYRYSVTWQQPWYYKETYHDWYEKNKDKSPVDEMDWYFI